MDHVFQVKNNIFIRSNDQNNVVVMDVEDSQVFYEIDGVAAEVFLAMDGELSVSEIIAKIKKPDMPERLTEDVKKFITDLIQKEIIE